MKKGFPTIKSVFYRCFFVFLLLLGLNESIMAQNIDFDAAEGCPNNPSDLTDQLVGHPVSGIPSITAVNSPGGAPFTMSIQTIDVTLGGFSTGEGCNSCASPVTIHGITFTISGTNVTITGSPDAASVGYNYSIILTATPNAGSPCSKTYTFDIVRNPVDLMLVLDKSGSMGTSIGGSDTRWTKLKSGVDQFLANYQPQLLSSGGANGDQIGIRMFSSADAAPVNPPFNVNNFIPVTPSTNTASILDGDDPPTGSTAMGPGLLTAKNFLFPGGADNGHKKGILLFTDGEQNVPPDVVAVAGSNPTVSGTDLTNGDKIQIHTIGLGVAGAASQTLYHIAHESGVAPQTGISNIADDLATTPPDLNLATYLTSISNRLLLGSTPQYVDIRRNNFKPIGTFFGAEETFTVSKNIDRIFINIMSQVRNESQGRLSAIEKDGQPVGLNDTSYIKSREGNGWQTFIISVSGIKKKIPAFKSDGKWMIRVTYNSQIISPYVISLTVDDHHSEMIGATTQTKELIVGDHLPLSISFTKGGKPITGATAMAVIAKPGDDLGDLLARTKADITISTDPDADNVGTQKLRALLKDSAFVKRMLDSNHTVNLTFDAAQKKYVGEFNQLDVSGVYQVAYIVSANDTSLGEIKRYSEESVYIRFPEVDLNNSGVILAVTPNVDTSTLTFRPVAVNGKFVGPGWDKAIKLDGTSTKITRIVDNGDGSYTITIQGSLTDDVTLSIGGDKIFTGKLENIGKGSSGTGSDIFKQWWFWLILVILLLLIIWLVTRKKGNP